MRWPWLLLLALAGCNGGSKTTSPDAGTDGAMNLLQGCTPDSGGLVFRVVRVTTLPPDQGFDLDGDGQVDNALGGLANLTIPGTNMSFNTSGQMGVDAFQDNELIHFPALQGPAVADGTTEGAYYFALETARPKDGVFHVASQQLDVDCQPTSRFPVAIAGGKLTIDAPRIDIFGAGFPGGGAVLPWAPFHGEGAFEPDLSAVQLTLGVGNAVCPYLAGTLPDGRSPLAFFVGEGIQPDLDLDGDGLEQIVLDQAGRQVAGCVDGDGTAIPGPQCACDPRMVDAYSLATRYVATPAKVVLNPEQTP